MKLQDLGIHSRWTSTIADWVDDETYQVGRSVTFCIEGNVGAGKSTWLDMVSSNGTDMSNSGLHEVIEVVPEPVSSWQSLQTGNLLELFYKHPQKYAFAFQQYVLITRMQQVCKDLATLLPAASPIMIIIHSSQPPLLACVGEELPRHRCKSAPD